MDVERVDARYDDEAGTVSVAFRLVHSLREHSNFTSTFRASVAQTDVAAACRPAAVTADLELILSRVRLVRARDCERLGRRHPIERRPAGRQLGREALHDGRAWRR